MTKLKWGDTGTRIYETGADRGVLYVGSEPGVPWNGLISVSESPSGGDPTPYYLDGFKYLNISSAEEFEATIEAFTAPPEFAVCDGTVAIHNGLFATQQPRKPFGFTYRSLIGNDVEGLEHGYKIHLVYNALAGTSSKRYRTLSDSSEALALSWDVTTTPVVIPGIKPTAHLVVDSTKTNRVILGFLEGILYGANGMAPRLPSPAEVVALFGWPVDDISGAMNLLGTNTDEPTTYINRAINPSWETKGFIEQGRNHTPRPYTTAGVHIMEPSIAGWAASSDVADATTPSGMGRATRLTSQAFSGASLSLAKAVARNILTTATIPNNNWYTYGYYVKHSHASSLTLRLRAVYLNAADGLVANANGAVVTVPPNTWTLLQYSNTFPATATKVRLELATGTSTQSVPAGVFFDFDMMGTFSGINGTILSKNIHGSRVGVLPDRYLWLGAVNDSVSIYEREQPLNVSTVAGKLTSYAGWAESGARSLQIEADPSSGVDIGYAIPTSDLQTGKVYTAIVTVNVASLGGTLAVYEAIARGIYHNNTIVSQAPRSIGVYEIRLTFVAQNNGLYLTGDNVPVNFDDYCIVEVPSVAQPYTGPAFHGDMGPIIAQNQLVIPEWTGVPNQSTSKIEFNQSLSAPGNVGDAYVINDELWVFVEEGYWENFGSVPV